jgi:hypothetical protein
MIPRFPQANPGKTIEGPAHPQLGIFRVVT